MDYTNFTSLDKNTQEDNYAMNIMYKTQYAYIHSDHQRMLLVGLNYLFLPV